MLNKKQTSLKWIGSVPETNEKLALIIPQYNELTCNQAFHERLLYFNALAEKYKDEIEVIIVDDGSSDESLKYMNEFVALHQSSFFLAAVYPNANKVGAIYLTLMEISHTYVILSDFDTDIVGIESLKEQVCILFNDPVLMGLYFRMLPHEGLGRVFNYQQLEYSLARGLYKFHKPDHSVPVMPGAGSLYTRMILIEIYSLHSGLRSGEDREATLLGLKLGYKAHYLNSIMTLTRPPLSFRALVKQRIRWNLGYIETFKKEKAYYSRLIYKQNRMGIRAVLDLFWIILIISLPVLAILTFMISTLLFMGMLIALYIGCIFWCLNFIIRNPDEFAEVKYKKVYSVFLFPFYKVSVDYLSWVGAFRVFFRNLNKGIYN